MNKQSTKDKLKFATCLCQKYAEQIRQIFPKKQQQQTKHRTTLEILQRRLYCKKFTKRLKLIGKYFNWPPSHLYCNSFLLLHEIFKFQIYIFLTSWGTVSLVQAHSTTITPIMQISEDDLLVCITRNTTKSCIKYINSSIYGLVELNESIYPALKIFRGNYDYQMIARINPFWLGFEPPNDITYYTMGILYIIIFVIGVTGNGLIIYMFAKCKALRTVSNILVFNLALCDFMIIAKCPIAAYNNFMRGPVLGDWACRLYGFVGGFSGCASIGMLTVISMDRYGVVVNPLGPLHLQNRTKYYYCLLSLAWFEAFFFSVIPLLEVGLSVYVAEGYLTTCSFDYLDKTVRARVFMFLFFVFAYCLPLSVICYCYFHILRSVLISKHIQSNRNKHQMEVRLAFIVLLVIGLWFLAWTPYSIVAMMGVFGWEKYLTPTISMIPALFCKTAACLNPFLYTISHKRFRHELQRLFCKRKPIYQYSATRSSYLGMRYRIEYSTYESNRIKHGNHFKTKLGTENATIGGIVQSNTYDAENLSANVFHHRKHQKKTSYYRKQISPAMSIDEPEIFILDVPPLETNC